METLRSADDLLFGAFHAFEGTDKAGSAHNVLQSNVPFMFRVTRRHVL